MRIPFTIIILSMLSMLTAQVKSDKYPDMVTEVYVSDYFEKRDTLYGGQGLNYPIRMDVNKIIGKNKDKWFVSLPQDSYIILKFTDNEIIDAPNQDDIQVVEHGCCHEQAAIYVSHEGVVFTFLGTVDDCDNNTLDLASINYKKSVRYIKVVGLDAKCASPGFDLVSVYGLPGANRNLYAQMEEVEEFFEDERNDKILILENVYFDTDAYHLNREETQDLDTIVEQLLLYPEINVSLSGHTDARASQHYNLNLSKKRAEAVKNYLVEKGITVNRIKTFGYGESQPLRTNETEEGRAVNRRVELRRLN